MCGEVPAAEYDGEEQEQDPRVDTEAVDSEEQLTNEPNPEGESAAAA